MPRKRQLSEEEKLLWQQVTSYTKPLRKESKEPKGQLEKIAAKKTIKTSLPVNTPSITIKAKPISHSTAKEKKLGDYSGIDRNTADSFRKGESKIDAKLDLHGMTSEKAHNALILFIKKQIKLENRRLLVITGKGKGILNSALSGWLGVPEINKFILAFDKANPKHGGDGAFYILLKRKRINKNG